MAELRQNTWTLDQWYDQDVAGNVSYTGTKEFWVAGRGNNGQLGNNTTALYSSPVQIPGTTWNAEFYNAITGSHVVHAKTDGTLWSWGKNTDWGQLGHNTRANNISSPVQIGSGTDWKLGGTTREGSFAIKTDGTLWTWGDCRSGSGGWNIGGNPAVRSSPTQVGSDTTWDKAFGGDYHMFGIKTDGTLWSWGYNANGRLALNTPGVPGSRVSSPTQVGSGSDWDHVSITGGYGNGAIKTDGTLWMWGFNNNGIIGVNDRTARSSPTQVPGTTWKTYSSGGENMLAVKTDGTLWAWGSNGKGVLGQNQSPSDGPDGLSSPTQIGSDTDWDKISSCAYGQAAIKTDGTLWTWGRSDSGVSAQNTGPGQDRSSPVQVPGTDWFAVGHTSSSQTLMLFKEL